MVYLNSSELLPRGSYEYVYNESPHVSLLAANLRACRVSKAMLGISSGRHWRRLANMGPFKPQLQKDKSSPVLLKFFCGNESNVNHYIYVVSIHFKGFERLYSPPKIRVATCYILIPHPPSHSRHPALVSVSGFRANLRPLTTSKSDPFFNLFIMAPLTSLITTTLDNTLGAALLGVVGASILSGTTFAQTYMYYHNYPQDSILNKCSVGILWLLDTLHLALVVHAIYFYNVTEYGNLLALHYIPLSVKLQALINVVIILLVHSLYAVRVWKLGGYHKGILGYLVVFVVAGGTAVGFVLAYFIFKSRTFTELEESAWAVYAALGTSTSIDFVIAAAMCYYLRKSKGTITKLNSKISKVIQYMISSGLFTSACSLAAMFSYILVPNTYICLSLTFLVTKLYAGSFLALLNSRERSNKRVSELFNTTPNTSWRRSLKIVTNSSASLFGPKSDLSGEATIQFPSKSVVMSQNSTYHWNSPV